MLIKILYGFYFLIWATFLVFAYAFLTDKFYQVGRMLGPVFGLFTLTVTFITLLSLITIYLLEPARRLFLKRKIFICLTPFLLLIPFAFVYTIPNNLDREIHTIEVSYVAWGCDCANWTLDVDNNKIFKGDSMTKESIFIEPASKGLELPDTVGYTGGIIKMTGQFYTKKGFPKNYYSNEFPEKARVFRYTKFKIIIP